MNDHEAEILESIKQFLKEYGKTIVFILATAIVVGSAGYLFKGNQQKKLLAASTLYETLLASYQEKKPEKTERLAKEIVSRYPQTTYAKLSALILAKKLVREDKLELAQEQLRWVMKKSKVPALRQIARIRLAKAMIQEEKYAESLQLLRSVDDRSFSPLTQSVIGDAQKASGDKKAAYKSYKIALENWPKDFPGKRLIELKLNGLAG